jgi:hypothetical protein
MPAALVMIGSSCRADVAGKARAIALLLVLLAFAGCGGHGTRRGFASCPQRVSSNSRGPAVNSRLALPAAPVRASICAYGEHADFTPYVRTVTLNGTRARTLARLLSGDAIANDGITVGCMYRPAVFRLQATDGAVTTLAASGCRLVQDHAVARTSDHGGVQLGGLTDSVPESRTRPAPDLIGRSLTAAAHAHSRDQLQIRVAGELVDPEQPFGTVLWQEPLPGAAQDRRYAEIGVTIAVGRAPACHGRQLSGQWHEGGGETGATLTGSIALRDVSSRPCTLSGRLRIEGRDRSGRRVTTIVHQHIAEPIVLPARQPPAAPPLQAWLYYIEGRQHGASTETCDRIVQPANWQVTLDNHEHVTLANHETAVPPPDDAFSSCHGDIGVPGNAVSLRLG